MGSDRSLIELSAVSTLVVSALITTLSGQGVGFAFVWAACFFIFAALGSILHHKRAHLAAAKDAALIAVAASLAVLVAILVTVLVSFLALPFSGVSTIGLAGIVAFVVVTIGVFVFQYAYAFRVEPSNRMLVRALVSGLAVAVVAMVALQFALAVSLHDQLGRAESAVPSSVLGPGPGTPAERSELAGTPLGAALGNLSSDVRSGLETSSSVRSCSGAFIDTARCEGLLGNLTRDQVDGIVDWLLIGRAYGVATNDSNASHAPLSAADLVVLQSAISISTEPVPQVSARSFTQRYQGSSAGGMSASQYATLEPAFAFDDPFHAALARLAEGTRFADAMTRFVASVLDRTSGVQEYGEVYVAGTLLERDPRLSADPGFLRFAHASLDAYRAPINATG